MRAVLVSFAVLLASSLSAKDICGYLEWSYQGNPREIQGVACPDEASYDFPIRNPRPGLVWVRRRTGYKEMVLYHRKLVRGRYQWVQAKKGVSEGDEVHEPRSVSGATQEARGNARPGDCFVYTLDPKPKLNGALCPERMGTPVARVPGGWWRQNGGGDTFTLELVMRVGPDGYPHPDAPPDDHGFLPLRKVRAAGGTVEELHPTAQEYLHRARADLAAGRYLEAHHYINEGVQLASDDDATRRGFEAAAKQCMAALNKRAAPTQAPPPAPRGPCLQFDVTSDHQLRTSPFPCPPPGLHPLGLQPAAPGFYWRRWADPQLYSQEFLVPLGAGGQPDASILPPDREGEATPLVVVILKDGQAQSIDAGVQLFEKRVFTDIALKRYHEGRLYANEGLKRYPEERPVFAAQLAEIARLMSGGAIAAAAPQANPDAIGNVAPLLSTPARAVEPAQPPPQAPVLLNAKLDGVRPKKIVDFRVEKQEPERQPAPPSGPSWPLLVGAVLLAGGMGVLVGRLLASEGAAKSAPRAAPMPDHSFLPSSQTPTIRQTSMPSPSVLGVEAQPAPARDGLLRGRYEIRGKIGVGGMGVVYEGLDHQLGRRVAIKQMRAELKNAEKERAVFLREAQIISHLSNPYIVAIHEVVEENGEIYLVFDFVDGKPLSQVLAERKRVGLAECQKLFSYVCEAIACAHDAHILHRDLKPSNIMVGSDGYAKVMDFGIAREVKDTITRLTHADTSGTPAYMAPEQHLGRAAKASDIYALGVCLYETLTGQLPFPGPDFLVQKERMKYPPPQFLNPELPKEAELLFAAALAADPKKRMASAAELSESLKGLKA